MSGMGPFTVHVIRPNEPEGANPDDVDYSYELDVPIMMDALAAARKRLGAGEEIAAILDPHGGGIRFVAEDGRCEAWLMPPDDSPGLEPLIPESHEVESHALAVDPYFRALVNDLKTRGEDT